MTRNEHKKVDETLNFFCVLGLKKSRLRHTNGFKFIFIFFLNNETLMCFAAKKISPIVRNFQWVIIFFQ